MPERKNENFRQNSGNSASYRRSLRACIDLEKIPDLTITIDADVIQADGGTRTASICGGFLALKLAVEKLLKNGTLKENPIIEPVAAISAGIVDGESGLIGL